MTFWLVLGALALVSGLWIARPYLRSRSVEMTGADGAISIYRDQIDELERDLAAGMISQTECDIARAEIERRALAAARHLDSGFLSSKRSLAGAAALTCAAGAAATALYLAVGTPGQSDLPLAARKTEELIRRADAGDLQSRIQLLIDQTAEAPESFEAWWILARSYAAIGDHASSADAYRHAANLAGDRPAVLSAYAEAMTLANGNKVPAAARVIFEQLASEQADPRARYYVALAKAQAQDFEGAIMDWSLLAQESTPQAPWMPLVRRDIVNMARFLKTDVLDYLPDATADEIAAAGGQAPQEHDIAELETALAADPKDYKAWIALARARSAKGDGDGAARAMSEARRHFAAAPFVLDQIAQAERAMGLDLIAPTRRGPSDDDIAAAASMTKAEQDEMIAGMVAGLAARLEADPNDPDGWVMLVRSYATLGDMGKARAAYEQASGVFEENPQILQAIQSGTRGLIDVN